MPPERNAEKGGQRASLWHQSRPPERNAKKRGHRGFKPALETATRDTKKEANWCQRRPHAERIAERPNSQKYGRQPGFEPETWSQRFQLKPVTSQDKQQQRHVSQTNILNLYAIFYQFNELQKSFCYPFQFELHLCQKRFKKSYKNYNCILINDYTSHAKFCSKLQIFENNI